MTSEDIKSELASKACEYDISNFLDNMQCFMTPYVKKFRYKPPSTQYIAMKGEVNANQ